MRIYTLSLKFWILIYVIDIHLFSFIQQVFIVHHMVDIVWMGI